MQHNHIHEHTNIQSMAQKNCENETKTHKPLVICSTWATEFAGNDTNPWHNAMYWCRNMWTQLPAFRHTREIEYKQKKTQRFTVEHPFQLLSYITIYTSTTLSLYTRLASTEDHDASEREARKNQRKQCTAHARPTGSRNDYGILVGIRLGVVRSCCCWCCAGYVYVSRNETLTSARLQKHETFFRIRWR